MKKNLILMSIIITMIFITGCSNKNYNQIFIEQTNKYGINTKTMKAICKYESGWKTNVVNVNKSIFNVQQGSHFFDSAFGANLYMDTILDPLGLNYDVGICQINKMHFYRFKVDNEDLLEAGTNIMIGTKIYKWNVKECLRRKFKDVRRCALSMYNTGKPHTKSSIGRKYANRVIKIMKKL